jgi:flagellar FliL protein
MAGKPEEVSESDLAAAKDPGKAAGAKAGGPPMGMVLGIVGGVSLLLLGAGFGIAFTILPDKIAASLSTTQKSEELTSQEQHSNAQTNQTKPDQPQATDATPSPSEAPAKKDDANSSKNGKGAEGAKGEGKGEGAKSETKRDFIISELYVNVLGTRGSRVLKASLYFDAPDEVLKELEDHRPQVIDIVSQILASKTMDQITAEDSRGILRAEIVKKVNAVISTGLVRNVYFLDFIVQ